MVLSPYSYNDKTGLALLCPITNQVKGYPFEVAVQSPGTTSGVVLADQVKSLDWRARNARFADQATPQVIDEVLGKVKSLLA